MSDPERVIYAAVMLDNGLDKCLDYSVPDPFVSRIAPGVRVKVPVTTSIRTGTVFALKQTSEVPEVKPIAELLSDKPLVSQDLFQLADWVARYYCCSLRMVLRSILPPSVRGKVKHKKQLFVKAAVSAQTLTALCQELRLSYPGQAQILDVMLKSPKGILLSRLLEKSQGSSSSVQTLVKKKVLECQKIEIERSILDDYEYFQTKPKRLNEEQKQALDAIQLSLAQGTFETRLIHGITGSGKTEIYFQAIEHALSLQKGVIFLIPEIALTSQTIERLRSRFQEKIAVLHHRLSEGERHDAWHQIHEGQAPLVVGARSAIFSPVPNLGLIIVDEEQESAYKQTDIPPCYHARDVAVVRGKFCNATVLLGSATPSFETYFNTQIGKYASSTLKHRTGHATLPTVHIVDMKAECDKAKGFLLFSDPLITAVKKRVAIGEQTILFLNRRGYHTAQMCQTCAHVIECPQCDVSLTFHLSDNVLACHLCDHRLTPPPRSCPQCKAEGSLKFKGAGTEMVERALHAILPEVRTLRLDADTTRHKGSHELLFKQFKAGKADVLIGTQMIAKGLHFPSVTLVGILNADSSLQIPDFRASENVFQLLTQVAGRSGRAALAGEVIIQTKMPEHPVIQQAAEQRYEEFYNQEIEMRRMFDYPPFTHLIKLTFSGKNEKQTLAKAQAFRQELIQKLPPTSQILPVIPSGHAKIKGAFRFQLLIKGEKMRQLLAGLEELRTKPYRKEAIRVTIDVDPLSTYL